MPLDLVALKEEVYKILVNEHDFLMDDAEAAIAKSVVESPDAWSENADPSDLANYLAEDDDDE